MSATPRPLADGLEAALAGAADGAFAVDADGRVVLWNDAAERILGHRARDVVGRHCCDLFAARDDHGNRLCYPGCAVLSLVNLGEPVQSFDMRTRTRSGRPVWLNVTILVPDADRKVTVHLFRDVTATKELLALVHERLARQQAADAAPAGPAEELTRREQEVLRLLAEGATTQAIADRLHVSRATVRNHAQNIFAKLGAHSRLEAVALARRLGVL